MLGTLLTANNTGASSGGNLVLEGEVYVVVTIIETVTSRDGSENITRKQEQRKYNLNFHTANIIQSIIFGGFHLTNQIYTEQKTTTTMIQMLSAVINGLINGYIYKYTNSIIPSIVSHISNNLVASHFNFQKYSTFYDKITQNIIFLNKNKINTSF
jgi:hypothetical protein